ncbi:homoserine dehydrogenase [Effusibacillus lacus]|uniref:Homoserine dehydrogenase n=1 Tax=Effusibacillus lacus TaxID=1348429 RepID=A0A292YSN7_9BACL|nr:homoserine dehydrogenase [Effusibacillus lacus]TCS68935.1 homoserine dehydrogenase [Effusibacillus lacus]GAX91495.1 homoserine dehydrogenase [Effusibacillus lacus]
MKQQINIGMLGLGTVGSGVFQVLKENQEELEKRSGLPILIKSIVVRELEKERLVEVPSELLSTDAASVVNDPDIDIVVEVMGGIEGTKDLLLTAFRNGKSVVTANKDLIAEHGDELTLEATRNGCDFLYEASVGGGIPIIRPLRKDLAGNRIHEVMGIVNGTTNYILTRMTQSGMAFEDALKEAQDLGYAEANPASDVEGWDAGRKIAIVASLAFNSRVNFPDVDTEGITSITARDIEYAKELGYAIKLIGCAKETDTGKISAQVFPALVPLDHPLASVNGAYNAIFVRGNAIGQAMFLGLGAGQMPTASAVVGDIVEAVRNFHAGTRGKFLVDCYHKKEVQSSLENHHRFYLRMEVADQAGVLGAIAGKIGQHDVSIQTMFQKWADNQTAEIVVITHETREGALRDALNELSDMPHVKAIKQTLRVVN